MKGTLKDFLQLVVEKPELARQLQELAARFDFEFTDELSDEDLARVAGGVAAPFVPGGSVVSAAISGLSQLKANLGSTSGG